MFSDKNSLTQGNEEDSPTKLYQNRYVFKKYKIVKKISDGVLGKIYSVVNNQNQYYAMKTERKDSKIQLLEQEGYHLLDLKGFGIPKLISFGKTKNYTILIEQYLGQSLFNLFINYRDKLTIQDKCLISIQLIDRIEYLHLKTLIHRDIKPQNFLLGIQDPYTIYLTEFRLCSKYKSSKTGKHIMPGFKGTFTGSLRFSSANAQKGMHQSRRDDLESIGYVILLFFKGKLPWDLTENYDWTLTEKDIYLKTYKMKKFLPIKNLCKGCPNEIEKYFKYVRGLKFEEEPDYQFLRNIFIETLKNNENIIGYNFNINNLTFSWAKQLNVNSISKLKKKSGIKSRLFHKFFEENNNKKLGIEMGNKTLEENDNVERDTRVQNIMKKTFDNNEYKIKSTTQRNRSNILEKMYKQKTGNNISSNIGNIMKLTSKQKIEKIKKNSKDMNMSHNYIMNREIINNKKYQNSIRPNVITENGIYINNVDNMKNHYIKINNNNKIPNSLKRMNKNDLNMQKNNLNINNKNNLYNQIYLNNNHLNYSKNLKPNTNILNNNIRKQINLNNHKINLTSTNLKNKYKPLSIGNKNKINQSYTNYNYNINESNSNQNKLINFDLLKNHQTFSSKKNNIKENTFINVNNRNIIHS